MLDKGELQPSYITVPLKKVPVRVAKYDVPLREAALRAVQAMHAILNSMVLFTCNDCKERFPTFHPAYAPPPRIAKEMELLKRHKKFGVAAVNVEVAKWDELPPLQPVDGLALCCSGTCLRCQKDMDEQLRDQGGDEEGGAVIALRSEENHMDPCFRFPDELQKLFDGATLVEAMLVALDHMQVNFVTVSSSGLRKFRRNTISFPQDVPGFVQRHRLGGTYRPGDRVNSVRGLGDNPRDPDRPVRRVTEASAEERERYAADAGGALVFPARVEERRPDGMLVLAYDGGGQGLERPEHVQPRLVMPWNPKDVPMHLMLRRNVGRGKDPIEGLQVRWWYVANLLQALCARPRNGYGPWRLGGTEEEPMHKYYDPRMLDVMSLEEMKMEYAPKEADGILLSRSEAEALKPEDKLRLAVNVTTPDHFIAAGFDVNPVGPDQDLHLAGAAGGAPGVGEDEGLEPERDEALYVDEETFCLWLLHSEFPFGLAVQRWWTGLASSEEGAVDGLKGEDDETSVELFRRICGDLRKGAEVGEVMLRM